MVLFVAIILSAILLVMLIDAGSPAVEVPYGTGEIKAVVYRGRVILIQYNMFLDKTTMLAPKGWRPLGTWYQDAADSRFFWCRGNPVSAVLEAGLDRFRVVWGKVEGVVIPDAMKRIPDTNITRNDDEDDFF